MGAKTEMDNRAIAELVDYYGQRGRAVGRTGVAVGAVVGVLVGAIPLSPLAFAWPIPASFGFATVLVGLGVGLLVGFVIGDSRARMYHRLAEHARAQLVLEARITQSDARVMQLVSALTARARTVAAQTPPAQSPVRPPAPVAEAPAPAPSLVRPPVLAPVTVLPPEIEAEEHEHVQQLAASGGQGMPAPPLSPPLSG